MAKVINRIGTVTEKYELQLTLHYLLVEVLEPQNLEIIWKKKGRYSATIKPIEADPESRHVQIDERLELFATMYKKQNGNYLSKKISLEIHTDKKGKQHKIGSFSLHLKDMSELPYLEKSQPVKTNFDKFASVVYSLHAIPLDRSGELERTPELREENAELQAQVKINEELKDEIERMKGILKLKDEEYSEALLRLKSQSLSFDEAKSIDSADDRIDQIKKKQKEKRRLLKEKMRMREEEHLCEQLKQFQEIERLDNLLAGLESQNNPETNLKLEQNLKAAHLELEELKKSNSSLVSQVEELQNELSSIKDQLDKSPNDSSSLDSELDKLESRMANIMRRLSGNMPPPKANQ